MKKTMKTLSIMLVIIFLFTLTACFSTSTEGIPHGEYRPVNTEGKCYSIGHLAVVIDSNQSSFGYVQGCYRIVRENDELFMIADSLFYDNSLSEELERTGEEFGLRKIKIEYNRQTKILTVHIPPEDQFNQYYSFLLGDERFGEFYSWLNKERFSDFYSWLGDEKPQPNENGTIPLNYRWVDDVF